MPILKLDQPYPLNESFKDRSLKCGLFGLFVFLFLFVFRPFEIGELQDQLLKVSFGYGMLCFVVMFVLNVVLFNLFPKYFSESKWTVQRELIWSVVNLLCIGGANFIYSFLLHITVANLYSMILILTYTLAVGLFPITVAVIINYNRWNHKYEKESEALNPMIEAEVSAKPLSDIAQVKFLAENGSPELEIWPHHFLYAKADDNYVELYYLINDQKSRKVIRNTLKNLHSFLPMQPNFYRCHKSFVINLDYVKHISGNAQGYKFHLNHADELIPVSRANNDFVKKYFTDRPKNTHFEPKRV